MPGYLNRFIDIDLAEYGEGCYIRIHNPKVVPQSWIEPEKRVEVGPNGQPVDPAAAAKAGDEVLCRLIKDWRVYDATVDDDEQPTLTLPVTTEELAKLPVGIKMLLSKTISDAMPNPN